MEKKNRSLDGNLVIALSRALQTIHRQSEILFRQRGITMAQFAVLEALLNKGDCSVGTLVEAVLSTSGNMTVVIRNLEQAGYVERKKNPEDKRSYVICLTNDGKSLIEEVFVQHMKFVQEVLSPIHESEKESIIHLLKKLA